MFTHIRPAHNILQICLIIEFNMEQLIIFGKHGTAKVLSFYFSKYLYIFYSIIYIVLKKCVTLLCVCQWLVGVWSYQKQSQASHQPHLHPDTSFALCGERHRCGCSLTSFNVWHRGIWQPFGKAGRWTAHPQRWNSVIMAWIIASRGGGRLSGTDWPWEG